MSGKNSIQYYIPERVSSLLFENKSRLLRSEKLSGGILFFDLVKFTRLTVMLSESGPRGAEKLHELMTNYYDLMIGIIHRYGGTIYQFAGDSALATFEKKDNDDLNTMLTICACALEMKDALGKSKLQYKEHKLATKFALAYGDFKQILLGDELSHFQIALIGKTVDSVIQAELVAHENEVVLSSGLAQALEGHAEMERSSETIKLKKLNQSVAASPLPPLNLDENNSQFIKKCSRFIPPLLAEKINASQTGYLGEFRDVTSIFIQAKGIEISSENKFVDRLNILYKLILELCYTFGGTLNQCDFSDKGSVFLVLFGAPVAVEKKESTAVRFALKLMESARQLNFVSNLNLGMATGPLYCGDVGSQQRKGYSVLGASVNLASRLMEYSGGEYAVMDQKTSKTLEDEFEITEEPNVELKGISGSQTIFKTKNEKKKSRNQVKQSSLLGRQKELSWLNEQLKEAVAGGAGVGIVGEAGVGKSRLTYEFLKTAREMDFELFNGICYSYEKFTPYFPWKSILTKLFNIQEELTAEFALNKIEEILTLTDTSGSDKEVKAWARLFYRLMGGPVEESEYTQNIDSRKKNEQIFEFIEKKLRQEAKSKKLLLLFEDFHWIDEGSENLISHLLTRNIPGLMIFLVSRPEGFIENMKAIKNFKLLKLEEFAETEAKEYLRLKMNLENPDRETENLENEILSKAHGNPFFLESIVFSLREEEILTLNESGKYTLNRKNKEIQIPDSLQGVLLARIDRLGEAEKVVLKNASVIGRLFAYQLLRQISPEGMEGLLPSYLDTLELNDFTLLETANPLAYIFKHVLIRDAAYHSMLSATRENLHNRLAIYLESLGEKKLNENLEQIAFHFYSAKNIEKAIEYSSMAARHAASSYAIADAIHHYGNILQLLESSHGKSDLLYDVKIELGHVYRQGGHFAEAVDIFQEPLEMVKDKNRLAKIHTGLGQVYQEQGQTDSATTELERALNLLGAKVPKSRVLAFLGIATELSKRFLYFILPFLPLKASGQKSKNLEMQFEIMEFLTKIYFFIDVEKFAWANLSMANITDRLGIDRLRGRSYGALALIYAALGLYGLAEKSRLKSRKYAQRSNDPLTEAVSLQRTASVGMYANTPQDWYEGLSQAQPLHDRFGETWERILNMGTINVVYMYWGKLKECHTYYKKVLELATSENARQFQGWALSTRAFIGYILEREPIDVCIKSIIESKKISEEARDTAAVMATNRYLLYILVSEESDEAIDQARELFRALNSYSSIVPHAHVAYFHIIEAMELGLRKNLIEESEAQKIWDGALKKLKALGKKYYYITGYALRAAAKTMAYRNKMQEAQKKINEAVLWYEKYENEWERALTWYDAALLIPEKQSEYIKKGIILCQVNEYTRDLKRFQALQKSDLENEES